MKKATILSLFLVATFILTACGGATDEELKNSDSIVIVHNFPNDTCESLFGEALEIYLDISVPLSDIKHAERKNSIHCSDFGLEDNTAECHEKNFSDFPNKLGLDEGNVSCVIGYEFKL